MVNYTGRSLVAYRVDVSVAMETASARENTPWSSRLACTLNEPAALFWPASPLIYRPAKRRRRHQKSSATNVVRPSFPPSFLPHPFLVCSCWDRNTSFSACHLLTHPPRLNLSSHRACPCDRHFIKKEKPTWKKELRVTIAKGRKETETERNKNNKIEAVKQTKFGVVAAGSRSIFFFSSSSVWKRRKRDEKCEDRADKRRRDS